MPENLHFSNSSDSDIPELVKLINSAYRGESSKKGWTTEADLLDGQRTDEAAMAELISKADAALLKYENADGILQGCVFLEKQANQMYLGMLTVVPHLQNSGIGKQLLRAAEAYSQDQACAAVVMSVISVRNELISWYERHGY